jgi:hypothetical protein
MADSRVYVEALILKVENNAAWEGSRSYAVGDRRAMFFDLDKPAAYVAQPGRNEPTVFASKEEAEPLITDFLARVRGAIRAAQKPGRLTGAPPSRKYGFGPVAAPPPKPLDIGSATLLFGHPGVKEGEGARDTRGEPIPGYRFAPYTEWLAARAEEQRFDRDDASAELAQADSEVQAAQAKADALRAEVVPAATNTEAASGKWVATDTPRVQVYARQDGTQSFRGRKDGGVSPSFDTKEEAIGWLGGDVPQKASPDRTAALEAMRDRVVRT